MLAKLLLLQILLLSLCSCQYGSMFSVLLDTILPADTFTQLIERELQSIELHPYVERTNELTKRGISSLDSLLSAVNYHACPAVQHAVRLCKYKKRYALSTFLAQAIVSSALPHVRSDVVLVPVPLFLTRLLSRGFNQSHLLAKHIRKQTGLPISQPLVRIKDTGHQAWRSKYERMENMHHAFTTCSLQKTPSHVVLIDDIATTGATLDACAAALKRVGTVRVDAWVVARA